jgi:hypothetical protein
VAKSDAILAWYRRLVAKKFDGFETPAVSRPPHRLTGRGSFGGANGA